MLTPEQLRAMARGRPSASNLNSVLVAINEYGAKAGLDEPHRLAHFLAQLLHESASFQYDKELWGPTAAQKRYDVRTDLGNTLARDGDGKRYKGRGPIQITGRDNYRRFTKWAKAMDPDAPNFERNPDLVNTDPWEGLGPIWYWDIGNPESRSLNRYADDNNIEMVTRRINGGLNGFADRLDYYGRAALVLAGYGTNEDEVRRFQRDHPAAGEADGIVGEKTRHALHTALRGRNPYQETVPVPTPTVPRQVDEEVKKKSGLWQWLTGLVGSGGLGLGWLAGMDWQAIVAGGAVLLVFVVILIVMRRQIIAAVKDIRGAVEAS